MPSPEQPEFLVELDNTKVTISGTISWQQLRSLRKPIALLLSHLTTVGLTLATVHPPQPTHPPAIEYHQSTQPPTPQAKHNSFR